MNTPPSHALHRRCLFFAHLLTLTLLIATCLSAPCGAQESLNQDLDDLLMNRVPSPALYQHDNHQQKPSLKAEALAGRIANMYRDIRSQVYNDPVVADVVDITAVCTITVRDCESDAVLNTIKTVPIKPTGNQQLVPLEVNQIPHKFVSLVHKLAYETYNSLAKPQGKSAEVMVQLKRGGKSQATIAVSVDNPGHGISVGTSFFSKDETLPNGCVGE